MACCTNTCHIGEVNGHVTYVFSMFMRWFFSSFVLWDFIAIFSFSSDSLWAFWNSFKQFEKVFANFVSITRRWRRSDSCSGLGSAFSSLRNLSVSLHNLRVACCLCCLKDVMSHKLWIIEKMTYSWSLTEAPSLSVPISCASLVISLLFCPILVVFDATTLVSRW